MLKPYVNQTRYTAARAGVVCHGRSLGTFGTPVQAAVEKIDTYIYQSESLVGERRVEVVASSSKDKSKQRFPHAAL